QGGFTSTLETDKHNDRRWIFRKLNVASLTTKDFFELALDDLDDLLSWVESFRDFFTECTLFDVCNEFTYRWYRDVSIQQSATNFACCCINICLCQSPF